MISFDQNIYIRLDIEELTRKTGNFKSFSVFLKMLESAITKVNENYEIVANVFLFSLS